MRAKFKAGDEVIVRDTRQYGYITDVFNMPSSTPASQNIYGVYLDLHYIFYEYELEFAPEILMEL